MKALRIAILSIGLFIGFTPFEWAGTYYSVAIGVLAPLLAIAITHPVSIVQALQKPDAAWFVLGAVALHMLAIKPTPFTMTLGLLAAGVTAAGIARFGTHFRSTIYLAARVVLVVQIAGLAIQWFSLLASGEAISLHEWLFPVSGDRTGAESVGVIRLGGFQLEPGTYSAWVAMLVTFCRLWKGRFGVLDYVAIASILGTYSAMGVAFVAVLVTWVLLDALRSFRLLPVVGSVTLAILIGFWAASLGVATYLENRFLETPESTSLDGREKPLRAWVESTPVDKLLGSGFKREDCSYEVCARELGFGFNVITSGGALGAAGLAIFAVFLALRSSPDKLVELAFAILIPLMAKAAPSALAPWLILFALADINRARRRRAEFEALLAGQARSDAAPRLRRHPIA